MFDDDGFLPGPGAMMDVDELRERIAETRRAAKVCGEFAAAQDDLREFLKDWNTIDEVVRFLQYSAGPKLELSESDAALVSSAKSATARGIRSALARYPGAMAELEKFRREQVAKNSDA